jgi:hypothetical protein
MHKTICSVFKVSHHTAPWQKFGMWFLQCTKLHVPVETLKCDNCMEFVKMRVVTSMKDELGRPPNQGRSHPKLKNLRYYVQNRV